MHIIIHDPNITGHAPELYIVAEDFCVTTIISQADIQVLIEAKKITLTTATKLKEMYGALPFATRLFAEEMFASYFEFIGTCVSYTESINSPIHTSCK